MKKKFLLFYTALTILFNTSVSAEDKTITLSGFIDTAITKFYNNRQLSMRLVHFISVKPNGKIITIPVQRDGKFSIRFPAPDTLFYGTFEMENKSNNNLLKMGTYTNLSFGRSNESQAAFLFRAGDSVTMDIQSGGKLLFKGRGSEKLNCQWEIFSADPFPNHVAFRSIDLINDGRVDELLTLTGSSLDLAIRLRLAILKSYTDVLSKSDYNLLYLDAVCSAQVQQLHNMTPGSPGFDNARGLEKLQQYFESTIKPFGSINIDSGTMANSPYFCNLVLTKELYGYRLNYLMKRQPVSSIFTKIYTDFKGSYTGTLRDRMIYTCFFSLLGSNFDEAKVLIDDAINTVKDSTYKSLLVDLKEKRFKAFPFELYDAQNKPHRLSNYRGKVVVIDFWFTGCGACELLAATMDTITKKYKDNKGIVFLSVSTDRKDRWLKSVAGGHYTTKQMVNLHTNGQGVSHPLLRYYNITGFPQQLIIGREGDLITSSPPRPDDGDAKLQAFLKLLDQSLANRNN